MWDEHQRTQKIDFELERIKRDLREQDRELEVLMEACGVEPDHEDPTPQGPPTFPDNTFVLRG